MIEKEFSEVQEEGIDEILSHQDTFNNSIDSINYIYPTLPNLSQETSGLERLRGNPLSKSSPPKSFKIYQKSRIQDSPGKQKPVPTKCTAPKFSSKRELERRKQMKDEKVMSDMEHSLVLSNLREKQRKLIKEDYEVGREQEHVEKIVYNKEKKKQWKKKLANSPFCIDLVADAERIEEANRAKEMLMIKRKKEEEKKLSKLKNNLIVDALMNLPTSDDAQRLFIRQYNEEEKRMKALRDIQKAEIVHKKQQKKQMQMEKQRMKNLEKRALQDSL